MHQEWFKAVTDEFRASPALRTLGFESREINWHDKGQDRSPLLRVGREPADKNASGRWQLGVADAPPPFQAIWFHFECRRPGDWRIDCEFWP